MGITFAKVLWGLSGWAAMPWFSTAKNRRWPTADILSQLFCWVIRLWRAKLHKDHFAGFDFRYVWNQDTMLAALNNVSSDPDLMRILVSRDWGRGNPANRPRPRLVMLKPTAAKGRTHLGWSNSKRWRTHIVGGNSTVQDPLHQRSHRPSALYPPWDVCTRRTFIARRHSSAVRVCFTSIEAASFSYCRRYCTQIIIFRFNLFLCNISFFLPVKLLYLSHCM